jgi:hypothetical protein
MPTMITTSLHYEMTKDSLNAGDYRVEAIDHERDGEVYVTIFSGPDAEARAEEYARWKNS